MCAKSPCKRKRRAHAALKPPRNSTAAHTATALSKVQGGTGPHVDGDVSFPLSQRPFQAYVHLSDVDTTLDEPLTDGTLRVIPGFHNLAQLYFQLDAQRPPAGGFTPLTAGNDPHLVDPTLWLPVRRLPKTWVERYRPDAPVPPSPAPPANAPRSVEALVRSLHALSDELCAELADSEPPMPGDYVLWDTRLPHSTGPCDSHNLLDTPRQVFYCAYMMADEAAGLVAEHRTCRESALHPPWAPASHRRDEMRADYKPAPLSPLGRALYGYHDEEERAGPAALGRGARGSTKLTAGDDAAWDALWASASSVATGLTAAHAAFFERYGYVVVERAVDIELVARLRRETHEYLLHRYALDLAPSASQHLTLQRLQRAFSPDGSGMLEVYWLPSMEEARQSPRLLNIYQQLYAATWGRSARGFTAAHCGRPPPARPRLAVYVDRTSIRLPFGRLAPILRGEGLRIRVPVPREASGLDDGVFYVEKLLDRRLTDGGGIEYLVQWKDWDARYNSWEPESNICDRALIDALDGVVEAQPLPSDVGAVCTEDGGVYLVDAIVNDRMVESGGGGGGGPGREFLVRWKGYAGVHASWEPEANIRDESLIAVYDAATGRGQCKEQEGANAEGSVAESTAHRAVPLVKEQGQFEVEPHAAESTAHLAVPPVKEQPGLLEAEPHAAESTAHLAVPPVKEQPGLLEAEPHAAESTAHLAIPPVKEQPGQLEAEPHAAESTAHLAGRPLTREEAWPAAHESAPDAWATAAARAHDDGDPLSLDDIPEDGKDV